jgi:hypothetical protein
VTKKSYWTKRYANDPEFRAKKLADSKARAARDPEKQAAYMKEYRRKNPGKWKLTPEMRARRNEARRKRYAEDPEFREAHKTQVKDWSRSNPQKKKHQRLLAAFGIELSDFEERMALQNGMCAICGHSDTSKPKFFPVVDHCHKTGLVRGILCANCNHGLGKFKDDVGRLFAAISYLTRNGSPGATTMLNRTTSKKR